MVIMPEKREERAASEISCLTRLARIGMQRGERRRGEGTSKADTDKEKRRRDRDLHELMLKRENFASRNISPLGRTFVSIAGGAEDGIRAGAATVEDAFRATELKHGLWRVA